MDSDLVEQVNFSDYYISFICYALIDKQSNTKIKTVTTGMISVDEDRVRDDVRNIVQRDSLSTNLILPIVYKINDRKIDELYMMSLEYFEDLLKL